MPDTPDDSRVLGDWKALIRARLRSMALDEEVLDEIAQHADELARAAELAGRSPAEARAAVEAEMVHLPRLVREAAAARRRRAAVAPPVPAAPGRWRMLSGFLRDLSYAVRLLAARPAFASVAILTLALGIGANTAIFSIVHSVLLAPLPFPDPDRLVMLWESDKANPNATFVVAAPNWKDWTDQCRSFEHTAIWEDLRFNIAGGADPQQVAGLRVSSTLFPMLGVAPQLGRSFSAEEDAPGHDVVVISDGLWRSRFGAGSDIVGATMRLDGRPIRIIGVMPPAFVFPQRRYDVWVPIAFTRQDEQRGAHSFFAAARLKPGVSLDQATTDIRAVAARLEQQFEWNRNESASITPMNELGVSHLQPTMRALLWTVGLVLLIACVNVANLLLAHAAKRQREFAIREALGAGRGRLASQLFAEGLVLALAGGAAGIALAWAGTAALAGSLPPSIRLAPFREVSTIPLDPVVLAFTFGLAALTGVLFTLVPVLSVVRVNPTARLRAAGERGATAGFTSIRSVLVAAEIALAVVVLAAAGLMVKSVHRLIAVDPGVDATNVLLMDMALPQADTYGPPARPAFCDDVQREVGGIPAVRSVAAISHLPLSGANAGRSLTIEGRPAPPPGQGMSAAYRLTCPGYFTTLGIPIVRGRDFAAADTASAPGVVIINEAAAAMYWKDEDPIGQRLKLGGIRSTNPWLTVVGVAKNVRHFGLDADISREMFRPYSQATWPTMTIAIKTAVTPLSIASPVRAGLARIDPDQPVSLIRTMEQVVTESMGSRWFPMLLLVVFSAVALALAAIGVYGVVSYVVSQRTREIGIRMALGAQAGEVTRLVVWRALVPIGAGLACGVLGSVAASGLLSTLLYHVEPGDPAVLGSIVAVLAVCATSAALIPARRAAAVDPLIALRDE